MLGVCHFMQISPENIIFIVVIITSVSLMAALFLLLYVRLYNERKKRFAEEKRAIQHEYEKLLLQTQVEVQEATFSSLGRELHDNIGQLLSSTKLLLGLYERSIPEPPDTLKTASTTVSTAINELRALTKSLDKNWLEQFSFVENLKMEVRRLNSVSDLQVSLNHPANIAMENSKQIILFRIVQEALQNAIKHAGASKISIEILEEDHLIVVVADDGKGFSTTTTKKGVGLLNMLHRCKMLGGDIRWDSVPGSGTRVRIEMPGS